ncbi:MAG: septal ring lytic transglycosylase RlpA family protein [Deltaproteobacteria bacterium]|nr:septal ring lytic transglycosylase RlpA family protein [bacterium]MCB9489125.1 septal ring lytic transglycosylase RlpA family protein [Deltaproteobacteria bacterium]
MLGGDYNVQRTMLKVPPAARLAWGVFLVVLLLMQSACAQKFQVRDREDGWTQRGTASWYGKKFHGRQTASGEIYNMNKLTAAHPSLPFGTVVRVTSLTNGRSVIVRINDRGPSTGGRIIDLSYAAAKEIGMIQAGLMKVEVEVLETPRRY